MKKLFLQIVLLFYCITTWAQQPFQYVSKWGVTGSEAGQFRQPRELLVDRDGNIVVLDVNNFRVQKFTPEGEFLSQFGRGGEGPGMLNGPTGIAVNSKGEIYISDNFNHRIQKFIPSGGFASMWGSEGTGKGQFKNIGDLAIDKFDNVYVPDYENNRVQKFTTEGEYITEWGASGPENEQLNFGPLALDVDLQGNVYVADGNRIQIYTSDGVYIKTIALWFTPASVFVDKDGNIYMGESQYNFVFKYDSNGNYLGFIGGTGNGDGFLDAPKGVAVDGKGFVYVVEAGNNRIQKFKPFAYGISSPTVGCSGNFSVKVQNYINPTPGVIGLDVCLKYDPAIMTAKSTYTIGKVVNAGKASWAVANLNISTPGEIKATIYYTSSAPATTSFKGIGDIITFDFSLKSNIQPQASPLTSCGITESNMNNGGYVEYPVHEGSLYVSTNQFTSKLYYAGTYVPMGTSTVAGSYYNVTRIYPGFNCRSTNVAPVKPDTSGVFTIPFTNGEIVFERDIRGSYEDSIGLPSIMSVINGNDVVLASNFIVGKTLPNFYQLVAADVNLDGRVTAGDLTLMTRRYLLKIGEFPQLWNYNGYVPNENRELSKDWLFIDDSSVVKYSNYSIKNVPSIPNCIQPLNVCPTTKDKYRGILLGDVDGSWAVANKAQRRAFQNETEVLFNLAEATYTGGGAFSVPVYVSADDDISSVDFSIDVDSTVSILKVTSDTPDLIFDKNVYGRSLLVGSYVSDGYIVDSKVFSVSLKINDGQKLNENLFGGFNAYINGTPVSSKIGTAGITTGIVENNSITDFHVYPNPTKGAFTVELKNADLANELVVYNVLGIEVARFSSLKGNSINEFDLSELKAGVYQLKLVGDNFNRVNQLVIEE
ncbi:T9SS type A sorting domain-containing protein [Sporocytophaga myxococcoides]|uniref:T9SS type A sorting domain-containing protein n=1 Tax=Sporocytophaga myxococcoides TaxID=153721 RepID=UPI000424C99F|nr:T9SS type A sorting domain-containing protein [Sporocytophaga myxococcoides]